METDCGKDPLPHHEQQPLCTSRLAYRQGRKLTAVKVYTINNESNHLLIFGVPSINIRHETKNLFNKFGKLLKFNVTNKYKTEKFTETYHAMYENIKSARIAKKFIDTKNFYGGTLHVCYAPELETIEETRKKLLIRKKDVLSRLKNIQTEKVIENAKIDNEITGEIVKNEINPSNININENKTLNMGNENIIYLNNRKRKLNQNKIEKNKQKSKNKLTNNLNEFIYNDNEFSTRHNELSISHNEPSFSYNEPSTNHNEPSTKHNASYDTTFDQLNTSNLVAGPIYYNNKLGTTPNESGTRHNEFSTNQNKKIKADTVEIIDFTSTERETISNINEALNYNKFGNEVIRKIENKTLNRIKFNFNK